MHPEKKKKRRKKKTGKKLASGSSGDNLEVGDEVEAGVRWVEEKLGGPLTLVKEVEERPSPLKALLQIENKHLNPENEMRRIFGTRVVQNEALARQRKARGRPQHTRATILVTPKPSWPSAARSGLSMRPIASDSPGQWFTFDHNPTYQAVQLRFLAAVESLNPDQIVAILNTHPMHLDSMLQLSDICKMGEDQAMAAELVERTLYALESAFHPCFSLAAGSCHLDYRRSGGISCSCILNTTLGRRTELSSSLCSVTFISWGPEPVTGLPWNSARYAGLVAVILILVLMFLQVLLALDPEEDPLAIVLLVDFYALRARQFQWVVDLYTAWDPARNLSQLPNFAYSVALAAFHLGRGKEEGKGKEAASGQQEMQERADQLLQEALLSFPSVLLPLLDKCSIEPHPGLVGESYFLDSRGEAPALATLCSLYVCRSHRSCLTPALLH